MAANEGGALARTVSAMLSAGGEFACGQPAWAGRGRRLSGLTVYPGPPVDACCGSASSRRLCTATWQRSRAGAESIVSALLTRKDGHSVYAC